MTQKIKRENLSTSVIHSIGEYILSHRLQSGDKLLTEMEFAEMYGVSRNVVREALRSLVTLGVLKTKSGHGTVLSSEGVQPFLLPFVFGITHTDTGLNYLAEMREVFEQGAVQLAVRHATDDELTELLALAQELDAKREQLFTRQDESVVEPVITMEIAFHRKLLGLSQNPIFQKFGALWRIFFSQLELQAYVKSIRARVQESKTHTEIVEVMQTRDEGAAVAAVKSHLIFWRQKEPNIKSEMLVALLNQEE